MIASRDDDGVAVPHAVHVFKRLRVVWGRIDHLQTEAGARPAAGGADSTASRTPSWSAARPTRDPAGAKRAAGGPSNTFERGPSIPASAPAPPETVTSQVPPRR